MRYLRESTWALRVFPLEYYRSRPDGQRHDGGYQDLRSTIGIRVADRMTKVRAGYSRRWTAGHGLGEVVGSRLIPCCRQGEVVADPANQLTGRGVPERV